MGEHNITNESLAFSMVLVLIAIVVSYREKLGLEKDILWSICRAVIQLIIVGLCAEVHFQRQPCGTDPADGAVYLLQCRVECAKAQQVYR